MCLMVLVWACSEASRLFFVTWLSRSLWILLVCCNLVCEVGPITLNVQSLKLGERLTRKRQKKLNALGVRSAAAVTPITSAKNKKPRNRRFKRRARPPKNWGERQ